MADILDRTATSRESAHEAAKLAYAEAQCVIENGTPARIVVTEVEDGIGVRQRNFFHGVVLAQIAERVRMPDGSRYVLSVWKEYFRQLFLPDKWVMRKQPRWDAAAGRVVQPKRATPQRIRQSTEDLGPKRYSELIDQVIAHAVTECGVEFEFDAMEREGVRYTRPTKRAAEEVPA